MDIPFFSRQKVEWERFANKFPYDKKRFFNKEKTFRFIVHKRLPMLKSRKIKLFFRYAQNKIAHGGQTVSDAV